MNNFKCCRISVHSGMPTCPKLVQYVLEMNVSFGPVPWWHLIGIPADKESENERLQKTFPAGPLQLRMTFNTCIWSIVSLRIHHLYRFFSSRPQHLGWVMEISPSFGLTRFVIFAVCSCRPEKNTVWWDSYCALQSWASWWIWLCKSKKNQRRYRVQRKGNAFWQTMALYSLVSWWGITHERKFARMTPVSH